MRGEFNLCLAKTLYKNAFSHRQMFKLYKYVQEMIIICDKIYLFFAY